MKKKKMIVPFLTAFTMILAMPFSAYAAPATGPALENPGAQSNTPDRVPMEELTPALAVYNGDVNTLKTAAQTDKLIVVVGDPSDPAKSELTYYEKGEDGLLKAVFATPAVSGMNGISAEKIEGDKKTPQGVYSFTMAFGMKDDPGSVLPYRKVVKGDHFVDDSASSYYNRLVNEFQVEKDWNSSENLISQAPHYNYALVLNYNDTYTPGKGSAIFLHCPKVANNTGTSGCISIPEELMKGLVTKADQNTKIIVVPEEKELALY